MYSKAYKKLFWIYKKNFSNYTETLAQVKQNFNTQK